MFNHEPSDLVDVFPNPQGAFVQVWDSPRDKPGRRLLLTYLRTPSGPCEVSQHLHFDEGPFEAVIATDLSRAFYYRGSHDTRHERILPSGRRLIHDPRNGLKTRSVFTADFDWTRRTPKGKELGDKPVMRLQTEGAFWYVSIFQESPSQPETLWLVEEHRGRELVRVIEFGSTPLESASQAP